MSGESMTHEARFEALRLDLPPVPKPMGVYRPLVVVGNLAYLSGHGPLLPDGSLMVGCVGREVDQQAGHAAARQTGLAMLATLRSGLGNLDRVKRLVKLLGLVNCVPEFDQQPAVINGCSQLLVDVFGSEAGVGARSAIGAAALPSGMTVEIEAIFELVD